MSTIIVCGRLGKDAECRTLQSGKKVAQFSIADEVGWGDKRTTQWIQCAMFGERAEKIAPHLTKGKLVEVVGTPQAEGWEKNGKVSAAIKVTVNEVKLHGGGKRDSDEPVADRGRATSGSGPAHLDEEIPFAPEWR